MTLRELKLWCLKTGQRPVVAWPRAALTIGPPGAGITGYVVASGLPLVCVDDDDRARSKAAYATANALLVRLSDPLGCL